MRSLIVQMKIIPLPVFLETADETETREVIISLGHCIRNNAATNIFNKDLDSQKLRRRPLWPGFLFDYDAVEKLTEVKIRTNSDREPGEEACRTGSSRTESFFCPRRSSTACSS